MADAKVRELQKALNAFTKKYLRGVTPLLEDGVKGHATDVRVQSVKWYLGYGKTRTANSPTASAKFWTALRSPKARSLGVSVLRAGAARRVRQRARATSESFKATVAPNVTRFDGVPCAIWLAKRLQKARDAGKWKGKLVSGYRSPAYSESLCRRMCGAPSCPGRCAGRASNHSGSVYPAGAVDVSDYGTFRAECARLDLGIKNALDARDPVHFSVSGR